MNRTMIRVAIVIVLNTLSASTVWCQSYEGYLTSSSEELTKTYPIWLDITEQPGKLFGSYFYKLVGKPITVEVNVSSGQFILTEKNGKGRVVGTFALSKQEDSLTGTWISADKKRTFFVRLFAVDSMYRSLARIPKPERLRLNDERTLKTDLDEVSGPDYCLKKGEVPKLHCSFARRGIAELYYNYEYCAGPYPSAHGYSYVFDCATGKRLLLEHEIDTARIAEFMAYVYPMIRDQIVGEWNESDEETRVTIAEHSSIDGVEAIENRLKESDYGMNTYRIREDGVVLEFNNFFDLPHVVQALDFFGEIVIPHQTMTKYLRPDSPLRKLSDID